MTEHLTSVSLAARVCARFSVLLTILALAACHTYSPRPLPTSSFEELLTVPAADELQAMSATREQAELPAIAIDFSNGIAPLEAAIVSVLLNPRLRASRATQGVAAAQTLKAGLLPDPVFSAGLDVPTGGMTGGTVTAFGLGLDWAATDLIDRQARQAAAAAGEEAVRLDILWQESIVAARAEALVYALDAVVQTSALIRDEVAILQDNRARVQRALAAGQLTETDLAAAEAALDAARTQNVLIDEEVESVRIELNTLLGLPPDTRLDPVVSDASPTPPVVPILASLLEGIETRRSDLLGLRRGYESQEERVRAAILRQFPRFTVGPRGGRDTGDLVTLGFGLSLELPVLNANRGEIATERATREQLRQEYALRVHEARSGLASEINRLRSAIARHAVLDDARSSRRVLVERYRLGLDRGQVDILSYYQARRDLLDTNIEFVQTAAEQQVSRITVGVLSGGPPQEETAVKLHDQEGATQ